MSAKPNSKSASDYELRVHRDWIGTLQPVGLVVSPPALVAAQAAPDRNIVSQQQALLALVRDSEAAAPPSARRGTRPAPCVADFLALVREVLEWPVDDDAILIGRPGGTPVPDSLTLPLPEFGETLRPTYAVVDLYNRGETPRWALLVQVLPPRTSLDDAGAIDGKDARKWHASPQVRLERLLRETAVPAGLLYNGVELRLVYAPRGESSGHLTWPLAALCEVGGRPLLSALCMLLGRFRLFAAPQPLLHILRESRKYQNVVSTQLAGQVLEALNELLRGFQAANAARQGQLLDALVREEPLHIYGGLLASLLRLVFILYAEERGLLAGDEVYIRGYSLTGLFEKLRLDYGRFPDTMEQRYGAWARLCVLFRMIHDGAQHGNLMLPARHGHLFDPDGWPFLEGRLRVGGRQQKARLDLPKVSDGVVYRVLEKLLLLDGDRLSYRALDVEQIGSVYEGMMGFTLERAAAISLGVGRAHVVIDLETLLATKPADRGKWLKERADCELSGNAAKALRDADTIEALATALDRRRSPLTPQPIPRGGLYLQPTDERRRSGSHYTPRELTEPIVRKTLAPLLADLGPAPTPQLLLDLRICDPAMGSGAFLVEACRQLAEQLVRSWDVHGDPEDKPDDEEPALFALRLVAQKCLYGVDKNPFAVDLGKLSLWLTTLAKQHSFTFVDHAVRHGDSLVGLTREQITCFHWQPDKQLPIIRTRIEQALREAESLRLQIQALAHRDDDNEKTRLLKAANDALDEVRLIGDCVVACFFGGDTDSNRKLLRREWEVKIAAWLDGTGNRQELCDFVHGLREGDGRVPAFHWELEFPEVFRRERAGFDGLVGNPPFLGGTMISTALGRSYLEYLNATFPESGNRMDLAAYFFRRAFEMVRKSGGLGLVATNTIAQGDTRKGGLGYICRAGGTIFSAERRHKWPGPVAVVVSVVNLRKGIHSKHAELDGKQVLGISPYLFPGTAFNEPQILEANGRLCFEGYKLAGQGFLFDDLDNEATPLAEMERLFVKDPRNHELVFPYIGGEEINASPTHLAHRYAINFGTMSIEEAMTYPDLLKIVETKVKPYRDTVNRDAHRTRWWRYGETRPGLTAAIAGLARVMVCSQVSSHLAFAYQKTDRIFAHKLNVFPLERFGGFSVLQSRLHELWARFLAGRQWICFAILHRTASKPSRLLLVGNPIQPSKPSARNTTSSAPSSWSATTKA